MAQHPAYPEHELIGYGNDLEGHLSMHAELGTYITAVGIVPDVSGNILTFDRPARGRKPFIPATLPQATLHLEDVENGETLEDALSECVADRLELPDDIEVEIIGSAYAFGRDNHIERHQRIYVPVLHHGIVVVDPIEVPKGMHDMVTAPRSAKEILELLESHDRVEGKTGQRNRAVTRFVINTYKNYVNK